MSACLSICPDEMNFRCWGFRCLLGSDSTVDMALDKSFGFYFPQLIIEETGDCCRFWGFRGWECVLWLFLYFVFRSSSKG